MVMLGHVLYVIAGVLYTFFGSICIRCAVESFKTNSYWSFGFDVMLSIMWITCLIKLMFQF